MSITVVIVSYNSSNNLICLFDSIIRQQYPLDKINVVVVDNNSNDISALKEIIKEYSLILHIKVIYRTKNYGFASSSNLGAATANDRILFLNPDVVLRHNSIITLERHMISNRINIIGGKSINPSNKSIHKTVYKTVNFKIMLLEFCNIGKLLRLNSYFYLNQNNLKSDVEVDGVGGAYLMIDLATFKKLMGFDKHFFLYLEDVDLCLRARSIGAVIGYCPHSIVYHIGGASSNNKHNISYEAWDHSREYFAKKHFKFPISIILIALYKIESILLSIRRSLL